MVCKSFGVTWFVLQKFGSDAVWFANLWEVTWFGLQNLGE